LNLSRLGYAQAARRRLSGKPDRLLAIHATAEEGVELFTSRIANGMIVGCLMKRCSPAPQIVVQSEVARREVKFTQTTLPSALGSVRTTKRHKDAR
jgi:hypothetical protein